LKIKHTKNLLQLPLRIVSTNKYPLLITLGFFLVFAYVAFFNHNYWSEVDGIYYFQSGEQILDGDGYNVNTADAPVGGPILYAQLNSFFNDGFFTMKIISLLSVTGIVFLSYYIMRNMFSFKIAIVGQLLVAFTPRLELYSILAMNEMLPILLISISIFLITKKHPNLRNLVIISFLLGLAFMIRYQSGFVFLGILLFILIRGKKININFTHITIMVFIFLISISPLLIYNYSTHGNILDFNPDFYLHGNAKYQTVDSQASLEGSILGTESQNSFLSEPDIFFKNYFYNLFYHNPNLLFNFDSIKHNLSVIPIIPFVGIIPVFGGLIYCLKPKWNKINAIILFSTISIVIFLIMLFGNFSIHFFAVISIPIIFLTIINKKNIEKSILPLFVLAVVFFSTISIIPLYVAEHLFPMWILIPTLTAIFIVKVIPKIYLKLFKVQNIKKQTTTSNRIIIITLILLLLVNAGFSSQLFKFYIYEDDYDGIKNEFAEIFTNNVLLERGMEIKQIADFLSKQPNIENSYIMSDQKGYSYYTDANFLFTKFNEGIRGDDLEKFVTRENWNSYELWYSNVNSNPADRYDTYKPIPDYLIYDYEKPYRSSLDQSLIDYSDLDVLFNAHDPSIPDSFELIYKSNKTGTMVYKIHP
jgi:4-amino-4-deoxy-L-arabinose transferase-like glycosyltransferase